MLKKTLFIPFCLSLFCSSLAYSQQATNFNALEKIMPETIQVVAQEIEKLTPEEKLVLKDHVIQTLEKQGVNKSLIYHALEGTLSLRIFGVGCLLTGCIFYYLCFGAAVAATVYCAYVKGSQKITRLTPGPTLIEQDPISG